VKWKSTDLPTAAWYVPSECQEAPEGQGFACYQGNSNGTVRKITGIFSLLQGFNTRISHPKKNQASVLPRFLGCKNTSFRVIHLLVIVLITRD
jgi:hypothetical protein